MRMFRVVVNNNEYKVGIEEIAGDTVAAPAAAPQPQAAPSPKPTPQPQAPSPTKPQAAETTATDGAITAPMPGTVLSVAVNVGDKVSKGQTLLILEAMKMENEIMAPADGTIQAINVSQGASVNAGETLAILS